MWHFNVLQINGQIERSDADTCKREPVLTACDHNTDMDADTDKWNRGIICTHGCIKCMVKMSEQMPVPEVTKTDWY